MIPFTLSRLSPSVTYTDNENICTFWDTCATKNDLVAHDIKEVAEFVYEFVSKEYGHGLVIASYNDFCKQWWSFQECTMSRFHIFEVRYFEDERWNELRIEDYAADIYAEYVKRT